MDRPGALPAGDGVIIIFGAAVRPDGSPSATLRRRVQAAFAFGGAGARYMPTGGVGRHGPSEASVMRDLLVGWGVRADSIICEETATDTLSSVLACARLWDGAGTVYAASSAYHLPRCRVLLRLAGVPALACPPPPYRPEPYWILREALALPWDCLLLAVRQLVTFNHRRRLAAGKRAE